MRIAVIGSGVAGLGSAWLLSQAGHGVDLFEADERFGGHAHTSDIDVDGLRFPVDTGFMVFNERTYPNLCGLFEHLGIAAQDADMSFSVACADANIEWSGDGLPGLFAQRSNLVNGRFWQMLRDIQRLDRIAHRLVDEEMIDLTLGELLDREGFGAPFRSWYLVPMASAIWSTNPGRVLEFPAASFLRFCHNHGLLTIRNKPQWRSVVGGSRTYVERVVKDISGQTRTATPIRSIRRTPDGVQLTMPDGATAAYDSLVIATHPAQALAMLEDPTDNEREILGAFKYQPNEAVLHTDERFLPVRRAAWAAWNYFAARCGDNAGGLSVTYWLTVLQQLPAATPVLCTIDPAIEPNEASVIRRFDYEHPTFDRAALHAQQTVAKIQGAATRTWYAGAWQRYGFHEDGLWSGVRVAEDLGAPAPWKGSTS